MDHRGHLAAHTTDRGTDTTADAADTGTETEVDRQERVQRELSDADAAEVTDWQRRGHEAFDLADPLAPANPAADPVAAEVLSTVRARSKTAIELREQFTVGYDQARRDILDPVSAAILHDEVAIAPEVVAAVDGRGPQRAVVPEGLRAGRAGDGRGTRRPRRPCAPRRHRGDPHPQRLRRTRRRWPCRGRRDRPG
ncbi:hypothetical protein GS481_02990 [Rhodococcus hoagii]|nr:hypothetical protein [Prescottella equi]